MKTQCPNGEGCSHEGHREEGRYASTLCLSTLVCLPKDQGRSKAGRKGGWSLSHMNNASSVGPGAGKCGPHGISFTNKMRGSNSVADPGGRNDTFLATVV